MGIHDPPYCGIGATIRIGREMLCLRYAGFFKVLHMYHESQVSDLATIWQEPCMTQTTGWREICVEQLSHGVNSTHELVDTSWTVINERGRKEGGKREGGLGHLSTIQQVTRCCQT